MFEVEIKFRVGDFECLKTKLSQRGVELADPVEEIDQFYQHPSRNFAETDEGLRIRRRLFSEGGEEVRLTYKGPKIDKTTKTRKEIELPLINAVSWDEMLCALGFRRFGVVRKFRQRGELLIERRPFGILLDRLPDLEGRIGGGLFVELETLAEENEVEEARNTLLGLAADLELDRSIRTSYLGLLLNIDD